MAETTTSYDAAGMFLRAIGAPDTAAMRRAVSIWLKFESGGTIRGNNPWNLHSGPACTAAQGFCPGQGSLPGQIGNRYAGSGDKNVAVFDTLEHGMQANANNLIRLAPSYGYGKVLAEARSGDAVGFLTALQNSSWSAGHYSYSKLVNAFRGDDAYRFNLNLVSYGGSSTVPDKSETNPTFAQDAYVWAQSQGIDLTSSITAEQWDRFVTYYIQKSGQKSGGELEKLLRGSVAKDMVGRVWGGTKDQQPNWIPPVDPITAVANAIGDIGDVLGKVMGYTLAVAVILVGLWLYSKGTRGPEVAVEPTALQQ